MTISEFESYMQKGLGRAILLLQKEPDKTPFREAALCYLKEEHDGGSTYALDLIDCFDDRAVLLKEATDSICRDIENGGSHSNSELLLALGMETEYIQSYKKRYNTFFKKMVLHIKSGDGIKESFDDRFRLRTAVTKLIRVLNRDDVKTLLSEMTTLFEQAESVRFPFPLVGFLIRKHLESEFGQEEAACMIRETADAHPSGALLIKYVNYRYEDLPAPNPQITAKEILSDIISNDNPEEISHRHSISFACASPSVVEDVAKAVLSEHNIQIRTCLLRLFYPYCYSYYHGERIEGPRFPFGERSLLPLLDDVSLHSKIAEDRDVIEYLDALLAVFDTFRHPKLKVLGETLRRKGYPLARYGIDLLISQYTAEDRNTLITCLNDAPISENGFDEMSRILHRLYLAAKNGTPDLPLDVIPSLWERIPTDNLRKDAVDVLLQYEMLPDELREECLHDRNPAIRKLVKENFK